VTRDRDLSPVVQGILRTYRGHVERMHGYRRMPGSTWTDEMVTQHLTPYREQAEHALYCAGRNREQVTNLLAKAEKPPPTTVGQRTSNDVINDLIRQARAGGQPARGEDINAWIRRQIGR
jgi:hypothetical protein